MIWEIRDLYNKTAAPFGGGRRSVFGRVDACQRTDLEVGIKFDVYQGNGATLAYTKSSVIFSGENGRSGGIDVTWSLELSSDRPAVDGNKY